MSDKSQAIKVTVTFAAADRPYQHEYAGTVPVATVLTDALAAFTVTSDGTTRYYLVHQGAEVPGDKTVSDVADHAEAMHLRLRTELIQGGN